MSHTIVPQILLQQTTLVTNSPSIYWTNIIRPPGYIPQSSVKLPDYRILTPPKQKTPYMPE